MDRARQAEEMRRIVELGIGEYLDGAKVEAVLLGLIDAWEHAEEPQDAPTPPADDHAARFAREWEEVARWADDSSMPYEGLHELARLVRSLDERVEGLVDGLDKLHGLQGEMLTWHERLAERVTRIDGDCDAGQREQNKLAMEVGGICKRLAALEGDAALPLRIERMEADVRELLGRAKGEATAPEPVGVVVTESFERISGSCGHQAEAGDCIHPSWPRMAQIQRCTALVCPLVQRARQEEE